MNIIAPLKMLAQWKRFWTILVKKYIKYGHKQQKNCSFRSFTTQKNKMKPNKGEQFNNKELATKIQAKDAIRRLKEYIPAPQNSVLFSKNEDYLKLDSNETTGKPSPLVFQRIQEFLLTGHVNWYPDANATHLREKIAAYTHRSLAEIQVFNGSDSALDYICRTFVDKDDEVLIASPTYDNFRIFAQSLGARVEFVFAQSPFDSISQNLIEKISRITKLVYICNPDNPTGRTCNEEDIIRILEELNNGILIIDEAYYEFSKITMANLLSRFENLIITRSFSKAFGLAALRCGYILAREALLSPINKIRNTKEVNSVAQIAAAAALDDIDYMEKYVEDVNASKEWLIEKLRSLGFTIFTSSANFILIKVKNPTEFVSELKKHCVLLRDRSQLPQLEHFVRVTVGSLDQSKKLVKALEKNGKISELCFF
jgi:histidinol-phosphate aminotransferase